LTRRSRALLVVLTLVFTLAVAAPVAAHNRGCTPGFWKNHPEAWVGYDPNQTIGSVFTSAPAPYDSMTLLEGLSLMGGDDLNGAIEILLRAAIAGLLNRDYPSTNFINKVNAKIETGDRATIIKFATRLDNQNNGDCTAD
jgi:hypothetical protein